MTVGIGLLCDRGKKILLAADMRASYGAETQHDQSGKLFSLPFNFYGAIAGSMDWCVEIISEIHHRMGKLSESELGAEIVHTIIRDSYLQIYKLLADEVLRNRFKITVDEYHHDARLAPLLRKRAEKIVQEVEVDVDLIVGGFVRDKPIHIVATGGTLIRTRAEVSPGNAVIGSGATAALNWLNYRKQNYECGLAQSLFHLTEAKQFSEVDPFVGPLRQIALLWPGGGKSLEGGGEMFQDWQKRYGLLLSDGLKQEKYDLAVRETFGLP